MSRSQSRGREYIASSGRGGVGNIRPHSRDPIPRGVGPDNFSPSRGRELRSSNDEPIAHSGRGGAGNVRSPSRDPEGERKGYEADRKLVKDYDSHQNIHSSGRGGAGNIDRSRSRDPPHDNKLHHGGALGNIIGRISRDVSRDASREPPHAHAADYHATGRGGYGNTFEGETHASKIVREDEEERGAYRGSLDSSAHTSGRGGYGNTSSTPGTGGYDTQAPHHANGENTAYASGRGGLGNVHGGY